MRTNQAEIVVAKLSQVAEYRACQEVQQRAWGLREDGYLVPVATLAAVNKYGGLVLGAWRGKQLVGFSFAFLGKQRGELVLYSQLTAVVPEEQGSGAGYALKIAQRQWAQTEGLATIVWAFDPMQAGNANFNLHRLGAGCRSYEMNMYGERHDALNAGLLSTDRLIAEWDTSAKTASAPLNLEQCQPVIVTAQPTPNALRQALSLQLPPESASTGSVSLEIPAKLKALVEQNVEAARHWQALLRQAFQHLFAVGYQAVDFVRQTDTDEQRTFYLLDIYDNIHDFWQEQASEG